MYHGQSPTKLRGWYQKLFGFARGEEWNQYWSEFATEPVTLCINGTKPGREAQWDWSGSPAIAFAVEDIYAAANQCKKRKVTILNGPVETSVCWMLFIEDPEGNRLILHQRKDGTAG